MGVDVKGRDPGDEVQVVRPFHLSLAFLIPVADLSFCSGIKFAFPALRVC